MLSRDQVEWNAVLKKVVDVIHLMACLFGCTATIMAAIRARSLGNWGALGNTLAMLAVVLAAYWWRHRLPLKWRSILVLGALAAVGFNALVNFGIMAQAGTLLPVAVVLAWMIWTKPQALGFSLLVAVALVVATVKNLGWGNSYTSHVVDYNRMPIFWATVWMIYLLLGAIVLGATRVLLGSVRSALDRKTQSEEAAREDRERLAGILEGINDVVFVQDLETRKILEVYGRYQELYGYSREAILQNGVGMLSAQSAPWTEAEAFGWIGRCEAEGPQVFAWLARRRNGELFWVEVAMRTIVLLDQERLLVTVRDIDVSKRSQIELANLNADLERRVAVRTQEIERSRQDMASFAYSVSHDLRTPLRAIDGFAHILAEDFPVLDPKAKAMLARILAGAERMGDLIDALLSLSQIDRHQVVVEAVDVGEIVRGLKDEIRDGRSCREIEQGFATPVWELGKLPDVAADPVLVRLVFSNLLGNACKFSRTRAEPKIRVSAAERPDGIWYEVADNGVGFDMAYADKLFKLFQRLHEGEAEGLGIGLATVKKVIERLGGEIEADAHPEQGATFRFRLTAPYASSELLAVEVGSKSREPAGV